MNERSNALDRVWGGRRETSTYDPRDHGARCDECPLKTERPVPPARADGKPRLVLVGEAPGRMEVFQGVPFIGPSGKLLDRMLRANDLRRSEAHITNSILCRPKNERDVSTAVACCAPRLFKELGAISKKTPIIALGKEATRSLLGVNSILRARGFVWQMPGLTDKQRAAAEKLLLGPKPKQVRADKQFVVHCKKSDFDVFIARPSKWSNPFALRRLGGGRSDAIAQFEAWVKSKPGMVEKIKKQLRGKVLGCWCYPKPCHGDVLARIANEEPKKKKKKKVSRARFRAIELELASKRATAELKLLRDKLSGRVVLPTLHPAFVLRAEIWHAVLALDFKRIARFIRGELTLKDLEDSAPHLVAGTSLKLRKLVKRLKSPIMIDVETDSADPLTCALLCVGLSDGKTTIVAHPWRPKMAKVLTDLFRGAS